MCYVITFQGKSVAELNKAFRESIDDYLAFCSQRGETPGKPFSGQFVTRISPELHRQVNVAVVLASKSLNAFLTEHLQTAVKKGPSLKGLTQEGYTESEKANRYRNVNTQEESYQVAVFSLISLNRILHDREKTASDFARRTLIPTQYDSRLKTLRTEHAVRQFASEIDIDPGVVVGRLQYEQCISYSHLNQLKSTFQWA